uniref:Interleukin-1 n=1 Tax=Jaculus jaculus TaxID=51337 RepID=A0A8C5K931_JACJA|nr:interleukin-1 alpha [Jaculus jaculus]
MAKVPDLFEDLRNCYSENEEYSSAIDHLNLNQKSFYDASCGPLHENCMNEFMLLNTSETSKTSKFTFKESLMVVSTTSNSGKILKKRRLSLNQAITDDDLEAIANELEETIKPWPASHMFQSNVRYKYIRTVKQEFTLSDSLNQSIYKDAEYLKAASLPGESNQVKFDMNAYSSGDDSKYPVTLRISNTQLFVSAQDENQPVLLKELPDIPKVITGSETNLIFFWKAVGTKNYFLSAAYPELFIATKEQSPVHMARGLPSVTDFQIS